MQRSFILSDENINERGFRVLTSGIDLERFEKNPVMLWMHRRDGGYEANQVLPIGKWDNIRIEDNKLMADPVFDENDTFAKLIKSKVDSGFVKGASIGIRAIELSDDPKLAQKGQTRATITKCELYEASVVDIPANKNTVQLFSETSETEIPVLNFIAMAENTEQTKFSFESEADLLLYMKEKFALVPVAERQDEPKEEVKFFGWLRKFFHTETAETKEPAQAANPVAEPLAVAAPAPDPKDQEIETLKAQIEALKHAPGAVNKKAAPETDAPAESKLMGDNFSPGFVETYKLLKK